MHMCGSNWKLMGYKLKGKKLGGDERFWGEGWVDLEGWSKRLI